MSQTFIDSGGIERLLGTFGGVPDAVRVPIAFNTPGILTGIVVTTLNPGDLLFQDGGLGIAQEINVTTAWDGTDPTGNFRLDNRVDAPYDATGNTRDLTDVGTATIAGTPGAGDIWSPASTSYWTNTTGICEDGPVDLVFFVDDAASGDPESTAGVGVITVLILRA